MKMENCTTANDGFMINSVCVLLPQFSLKKRIIWLSCHVSFIFFCFWNGISQAICFWNDRKAMYIFCIFFFLQVSSPPLAPLRNGNFAGGRRELALRLLSNGQEEETDEHLDATEEDDDDEEILIGNSSKNRFVSALPAAPQSLISGLDPPNSHSSPNLKKGILWQQRDKIFARWKERFFVLTKDYLQCFKKGTSRITEMGGFIYGIRLSEVKRMIIVK